ncbi:hypothetical protein [Streptomyces sp. NPDC003077]|uniref:hypothetical protein n=1 Tax=Streptomyces sp. NPDC003077 TaxID=3154443 RepID=UPI0033B188F8
MGAPLLVRETPAHQGAALADGQENPMPFPVPHHGDAATARTRPGPAAPGLRGARTLLGALAALLLVPLPTANAAQPAASPKGATSSPLVPAVRSYPPNWLMGTHLTRGCAVYENFPMKGVRHRAWHLDRGARVGVRYNVGDRWALVQDRDRASQRPKVNPHYGFVNRSCLAKQLPLPSLQGVGNDGSVRRVDFNPVGDGRKAAHLRVSGHATLRDAVHAFVIGNLRPGDRFVIGTRTCVVHGPHAYVHGYAPAARRWGYVEATHLPDCHRNH